MAINTFDNFSLLDPQLRMNRLNAGLSDELTADFPKQWVGSLESSEEFLVASGLWGSTGATLRANAALTPFDYLDPYSLQKKLATL